MDKMNKSNFSNKRNVSDGGVLSNRKYAGAIAQDVHKTD